MHRNVCVCIDITSRPMHGEAEMIIHTQTHFKLYHTSRLLFVCVHLFVYTNKYPPYILIYTCV